MTEGSISKKILLFALPIFVGQLLQQLYNIVDSVIVGKYLGTDALAAVTSSGSLIFLMVGFINGLFMGSSVIIGRRYGEKDNESLSIAAHTSVGFGFIAGLFLVVMGVTITPILLRLMGTPENVMPNSVLYFRVYFLGGLSNVVYNTCCGIFQAMGDSKRPLHYLIVSAITNVILDLLFVAVLGLGVGAAAAATAISQTFSAVLAFSRLLREDGPHRIEIRKIRIDLKILAAELKIGFPTAIQNSVIAIANVVVQSNINAFGAIAMAGCGSYFKVEGFVFLPITSFCMALTTFTSQNMGAQLFERTKKGTRFGILMGIACAEFVGLIFYIFAPVLIGLFSKDPEVIATGVRQARTETLFYGLLAVSHCMAGILRGAGKTTVPMFFMLTCWCVIRIIYITIAVRIIPDIQMIFWAYPLTWSLSSILFSIYYMKADWVHAFTRSSQ
ncbi:MAG: MATE family efflux transporter [Lachnospiraceae bacterium]|nr:MATE family efflux transporter [Lachnospiraceae bacterium]